MDYTDEEERTARTNFLRTAMLDMATSLELTPGEMMDAGIYYMALAACACSNVQTRDKFIGAGRQELERFMTMAWELKMGSLQ